MSALFHPYLCGRNAAEWLIPMKTFCKLTAQSPAASHMCRFRGFFCKTKLCATSATTPRCSMHFCWTEPAFPAERLCRAGRHHPPVLHVRTSTSEAPPQPPERHADLPGAGIQRSDYPPQAGFGQACPHHAELPSGRQTDRQGRSARCADLRPCAVCKPSTYALEITHRLKQQMLWKGGQRWKYF